MNNDFISWEKLRDKRKKIRKEFPDIKSKKSNRTFKDEYGIIRCSRCGTDKNIDGCGDCLQMKKIKAA